MKNIITRLYANNKEVINYDSIMFNEDHLIVVSYDTLKFKSNFQLGKKYHFKININRGMKIPLSNDYFELRRVENNSNHAFSFNIPITYKYYFYKV